MQLIGIWSLLFCLAGARLSEQQVVKADLPYTKLCRIPQDLVRKLTSAGFNRSPLETWTKTQLPGSDMTLANLSSCLYWSFDPAFDALLGSDPTIYQVGPKTTTYTYTETPAYLPGTNEIVFTSVEAQWAPEMGESAPNNASRLSLTTGELVTIPLNPSPGNLGGASYYKKNGQDLVVVAGLGNAKDAQNPPAIYLLDPVKGNWTVLVNNWFGQRFAGFDDVIAMKDGSIIMSDGNFTTTAMPYPFAVNVGGSMPYAVWILPGIGGAPRVLIGHTQIPGNPNGLALNQDETVLYVSCSPLTSMDASANAAVKQIFKFDLMAVEGGYFAMGPQLFAESDYGFSDGFKVDALGNVYGSTSDGVSVWNPAGTLIGKILVPTSRGIQDHPTSAIGFANNTLIIMHNTDVLTLALNTTGPAFVFNN